MGWINMTNYPPGVSDSDPHFNSDPDGDESADEEEEPEKCQVYECEKPQVPREIYCAQYRAEADDARRIYNGAKQAGMVEGV